MKSIYGYLFGGLALTMSLAACIPAPAPSPAPAPTPTSAPVVVAPSPKPLPPGPAISTPTIPADWADKPQTQGDWSYARESNETFAIFGNGRADPKAIIRCDLTMRKVGIGQYGALRASNPLMIVKTETQNRTLRASPRDSSATLHASELPAGDALLDAIALTRGRFALAVAGKPNLYLPAWAEVTRVIEDCR